MSFEQSDPLSTGKEKTLVNYRGHAVSQAGIDRRDYSERDRVKMLAIIARQFPSARVVLLNERHLGISIDFSFLYEGSDDLMGTDAENLETLSGMYESFTGKPRSFSLKDIEQWVTRHFQSFEHRWIGVPGIILRQMTNSSCVEYRISVAETTATVESLMGTLRQHLEML